MAHIDQVMQVLAEKNFPMEKIAFSYNDKIYYNSKDKSFTEEPTANFKPYKCCLLSTSSDKLMDDLRARVRRSDKTIFYILDQAPSFYPAIRNNVFEFVRAVFIPVSTKKL